MAHISLLLSLYLWLSIFQNTTGDQSESQESTQPNIIFVFADDFGYSDIGYHGSDIETPVLDELAANGVKLENYYVQPLCSPSRSQMMSGRYQIHTGHQHGVIMPCRPHALPTDSPTLADKLKESGYATHMVGKWHLGSYKEEVLPWNRGFDSFYGFLLGVSDYYNHSHEFQGNWYLDLRDNTEPVWTESGHYSTHLFTEKATDIIYNHNSSQPLFLYLAHQAVHSPLQVPIEYEEKYQHFTDDKRRTYAGMVSAMDESMGNLVQALKDSELWNNTVLVFSTDNGGDPRHGGNNYPLRGRKATLWEGGIRGVGFVAGGVLETPGTVNTELIHVSDWFPTLVGLAGGNLDDTKPLDGVDQWETINNNAPSRRKLILHNIDPLYTEKGQMAFKDTFDTRIRAAIRLLDYKLITGNPGDGNWFHPYDGKVSPMSEPAGKNLWLFNITADPAELEDISEDEPGVVRLLLDLLQKYSDDATLPSIPPPDFNCDPSLHDNVWDHWL